MNRRTALLAAGIVAAASVPMFSEFASAALTTSPVLIIEAHPDDAALMASVDIGKHIVGGQDVTVLPLTKGEGSTILDNMNGIGVNSWWGVQHDPVREGYATMTADEMGDARLLEIADAFGVLSAGMGSAVFYDRPATFLGDGKVTEQAAYDTILAYCNTRWPGQPVRIKSHSDVVDDHADHIAIGKAIRQMATTYPSLYGDSIHYIHYGYWNDTRLSKVSGLAWNTPSDAGMAQRVRNTGRVLSSFAPHKGALALSAHSKSDWVAAMQLADTKNRTHR